jgi:sugar phosphate isomerase/epimerase
MASPKTMTSGRRRFLGQVLGGAAFAAGSLGGIVTAAQTGRAGSAARWADRLGLQVYTVRDRLAKEFEATMAAIAEAGYKEVELFGSLGDRTPQQIRAILDRNGLTAPSTHITVSPGPDLEKQLEAWQIIGHRFTAVRVGSPRPAGPPAGAPRTGPPPQAPPATLETWRRQAAALNEVGRAGQKYGVRALVHNHIDEFIPMSGGGTGYDILLGETDPALVALELDLGWARLAGQDPIAMFKKHPGRYPLWHVKDTTGLAAAIARPFPERRLGANFVPVGTGDIDYKALFAMAATAGLQHFFIEQDNAVDGDSVAAIRTSAQNLKRILS